MDEKILTPDQVAQILQVHPFTILKFIKQGKLRASKLGRVYRIRQSDVGKFLDEQEAAAASKSLASRKQATPKEADTQTASAKNRMTSPTGPSKKGSKRQDDESLLETEETIPEPKPESFVPSVSKKQEQESTPNNSRTDEIDHYILD